MPTIEYNAIVDLGIRSDDHETLLDALQGYHPAIAGTSSGTLEAIITFPAESLHQAVRTALAVCETAAGAEPVGVTVMTTAAFDAVNGLEGAWPL